MFRPAFARRRPLLRAAVVGGGAYAFGKASGRRAGEQQAQPAAQGQQPSGPGATGQAPPGQPPPAAPQQDTGHSAMLDQLSQLATLHSRGALSDEEFAAAKARLLGTG